MCSADHEAYPNEPRPPQPCLGISLKAVRPSAPDRRMSTLITFCGSMSTPSGYDFKSRVAIRVIHSHFRQQRQRELVSSVAGVVAHRILQQGRLFAYPSTCKRFRSQSETLPHRWGINDGRTASAAGLPGATPFTLANGSSSDVIVSPETVAVVAPLRLVPSPSA